jgi:hypothetical protein
MRIARDAHAHDRTHAHAHVHDHVHDHDPTHAHARLPRAGATSQRPTSDQGIGGGRATAAPPRRPPGLR